jgi:hypothetical protein
LYRPARILSAALATELRQAILLENTLTEHFEIGVQFVHGGTLAMKRAEMVSRF